MPKNQGQKNPYGHRNSPNVYYVNKLGDCRRVPNDTISQNCHSANAGRCQVFFRLIHLAKKETITSLPDLAWYKRLSPCLLVLPCPILAVAELIGRR